MPDMLADALKRDHYDVVSVVHSETSTGVLNPIKELTQVAHASGDMVMVIDTVSSMAAAPIECARVGPGLRAHRVTESARPAAGTRLLHRERADDGAGQGQQDARAVLRPRRDSLVVDRSTSRRTRPPCRSCTRSTRNSST